MAGSLSNSTSGKSKYEIKETNKIKETVNLVSKVLANQGKNSNVVIEITKVKGQYVTKIYNKDTPDQSKKIESEGKNTGNKSGKDSDKRGDKDKSHKNRDRFKGETNTLANRIDYALSRFWGLDAKTYRAWGYDEKDIKAVFGTKAWERIAKEEAKAAKGNEGKSNNGQEGKPPKTPKGGPKGGRKGADHNRQKTGKGRLSRMEKMHGKGNIRVNPHPKDNNLNPSELEAVKEFLLKHKEEVEEATGMTVEDTLKLIGASDKNESPVVDVNNSKQWDEQGNKMDAQNSDTKIIADRSGQAFTGSAAAILTWNAIGILNDKKSTFADYMKQERGRTDEYGGGFGRYIYWGRVEQSHYKLHPEEEEYYRHYTDYHFESGKDNIDISTTSNNRVYIRENGETLFAGTSYASNDERADLDDYNKIVEVVQYLNEKYKDRELTVSGDS